MSCEEAVLDVSSRPCTNASYLSAERQRALADAVGEIARAELAKSTKRKTAQQSGTRMARTGTGQGEW